MQNTAEKFYEKIHHAAQKLGEKSCEKCYAKTAMQTTMQKVPCKKVIRIMLYKKKLYKNIQWKESAVQKR